MKGMIFDGRSALLGGCIGVASGGILSYLFCRRSFDARIDSEVAAIKAHYQARALVSQIHDEGPDSLERPATAVGNVWKRATEEPGEAAEVASADASESDPDLEGIDDSEQWDGYEPASDSGGAEDSSVASDGHASAPDEVRPTAVRDTSKPHVISKEEFFEESPEEHGHMTLTYYAEDHVLVDEKEETIPHIRETVGVLYEQAFGGISGDPNVRYVRNPILLIDFEIVLDKRAYTDAVLNYGNPNVGGKKRR